jgi:hypothetical protein
MLNLCLSLRYFAGCRANPQKDSGNMWAAALALVGLAARADVGPPHLHRYFCCRSAEGHTGTPWSGGLKPFPAVEFSGSGPLVRSWIKRTFPRLPLAAAPARRHGPRGDCVPGRGNEHLPSVASTATSYVASPRAHGYATNTELLTCPRLHSPTTPSIFSTRKTCCLKAQRHAYRPALN